MPPAGFEPAIPLRGHRDRHILDLLAVCKEKTQYMRDSLYNVRVKYFGGLQALSLILHVQGGSNMTGTDLCVNKPHCAAAVRP